MKHSISVAVCTFFIAWTLLVSAFAIYRTGLDDKTIMLAFSQCFFNQSNYREVTSRAELVKDQCGGNKSCEWRTSERVFSANNYPLSNTIMNLVRGIFSHKNDCRSMSLSIYWAYGLSTLIIIILFFLSIYFFFDAESRWLYLASLTPLVFLHPFFNHALTNLNNYGFPHVEELTYFLGPFPRSQLAMIFCLAPPLILNSHFTALAAVMLLNISIHTGQGTLANMSILLILFLHFVTQKTPKKLYAFGIVCFFTNLFFLIFAKSNYQATDFGVDLGSIIPAIMQNKTALLTLVWVVVGFFLKKLLSSDRSLRFYFISVLVLLGSMSILRTYNLSLKSAHEEVTTLLIIADRFDGTVVVTFYLSFFLFAMHLLRRFFALRYLKICYVLLGCVVICVNAGSWLVFTKQIQSLIPSYKLRAQQEICTSNVAIPSENLMQSLEAGTLSPKEEELLHLKIDRTCQGL